ncbi:MAG: LptF/LptG family permease [Planctomycetota bacterium]
MSILDRYIAKQYLINILVLVTILFSFVVTIDASINVDRFWDIAGASGEIDPETGEPRPIGIVRQSTLTVLLIADLWWPRLLQLFNLMLGVILVGAMGFTCSQMVRHRETVAILASGQSLRRVAKPILIVAAGMIALAQFNQEAILPTIAPLLTREHRDAGKRDLGAGSIPLATDNRNRLFYARSFDAGRERIEGFLVIERDDSGVGTAHITGDEAVWDGTAWVSPVTRIEPLDGRPAAAGIPARIETDLDPTALTVIQFAGFSQNLSWNQIGRLLEQSEGGDPALRERLQRNRYGRISLAMTNLLALVIAMPFFLKRMPGNAVATSLKGAPVAVAAIVGGTLGATAPVPGVPPIISVFIPVLVLAPVAVAVALNPRT